MPAPTLPPFTDPADHSPADRARTVAAILAAGLLRLQMTISSTEQAPTSATQKSPESLTNDLAVSGGKSVTVHAG